MNEKFVTGLTKAEEERLIKLMEECGEVIQAASKILRHGWDSKNPNDPNHLGNKLDLERELADLTAAVLKLDAAKNISLTNILATAQSKHGVNDYMHFQ